MPYAAMVLVLSLIRSLEESTGAKPRPRAPMPRHRQADAEKRRPHRFLDARSLDWAEAAGNYVEVRANGGTHLARISLSALGEQLAEAGVDMPHPPLTPRQPRQGSGDRRPATAISA